MSEKSTIEIAEEAISKLVGTAGKLTSVDKSLDGMGKLAAGFITYMNNVVATVRPFTQVQDAAAKLAKSLGLGGQAIMRTAMGVVAANQRLKLSMNYNISDVELVNLQQKVLGKIGRNVGITQVDTVLRNSQGEVVNPNFESELGLIAAASKAIDENTLADMIAGFDKVGKSMGSAAKMTGKLYKEAGEYGINLEEYAGKFVSNLGMAQTYNFRNGVNGLKEMARKATEIRQDMKQIASFADKVGTVTGAVETAANLQVLGGSFATMANPLAMLNESLTNMEGLQDRFNQMTAGAARYNSITHEIEMDPVTRQIMKRAAESMGVSSENLIDQAYAQARRSEIERQMRVVGTGTLNEDFIKLVKNSGTIDSETGMAGVTIGNDFMTLSDLAGKTPEEQKRLQEQLVAETRSESEDIKAIAKSVMTIEAGVEGREKQMTNEMAANKLSPGVLGGKSMVENVAGLIFTKFNDEVISGIARMTFPVESFKNAFQTAAGSAMANFITPFNANNGEEFVTQISNAFTKTFGDGPIATLFNNLTTELSAGLKDLAISVNGFTKATADLDFLKQFHSPNLADKMFGKGSSGGEGMASGTRSMTEQPLPPASAPTAQATTNSRPQLTNTSNFSGTRQAEATGTGTYVAPSRPIEPTRNTEISRATASQTMEGIADSYRGDLSDVFRNLSSDVNSIVRILEAKQNDVIKIEVNGASVPTVSVNPYKEMQTEGVGTENATETRYDQASRDVNIKLSGNVNLNLKGDKGEIGTVDLVKMIKESPNLQKELVNLFKKAVDEAYGQGLINNKVG